MDKARNQALAIKEGHVTKLALKYRGIAPKRKFMKFYKALFTLEQNYKLFAYINKMNKIRTVVKILQGKSKILSVKDNSKIFNEKVKRLTMFINASVMRSRVKK